MSLIGQKPCLGHRGGIRALNVLGPCPGCWDKDAPEPVGDGEDYDLEEGDLESVGRAEEDEHPVEEAEEVASLPEEADVAAEAMEVDGAGDGPNVGHEVPSMDDVMVLSDEETSTPPHKPMRMLSLSGSKLDVPANTRLHMLKMQLEAVK